MGERSLVLTDRGNTMRVGRLLRVALATSIAGTATFGAAASAAPAETAPQGWARFGHFAPSVGLVDVFVDGEPFAANIGFKDVSAYQAVPAGVHRFEVKPSAQPDGPAVITVDAGVPDDGAITIGAVTTRDAVASQVYDDALSAPLPGRASVRFIHAAPDVASVDVQVVGGPLLAGDVAYPTASSYQDIEPGRYDVEVRPAGSPDVSLRISDWAIEAGVQSSIVIVRGLDGQLDVVPVEDSSAVAVAPVGGIQTGYGGMAPAEPGHTWLAVFALVAVVGFAGSTTVLTMVRQVRARS